MTLTHFSHPFGRNPWREFGRMQAEVERLFDHARARATTRTHRASRREPVDLGGRGRDLAELPGIDPDKIDIAVVDDTVTLSGTRLRRTFRRCGDPSP